MYSRKMEQSNKEKSWCGMFNTVPKAFMLCYVVMLLKYFCFFSSSPLPFLIFLFTSLLHLPSCPFFFPFLSLISKYYKNIQPCFS